jgi:hypothetical protein
MTHPFTRNVATSSAAILVAVALTAAPVQARDFFSSFLGGFMGSSHSNSPDPSTSTALPFATEGDPTAQPPVRALQSASAYCVRTCDGRYFPISGSGSESRAKTCNSLCPASETKVVYGGGIDNARTDKGQPYSALPNAFRYRNEVVSGCTCNGKTSGGLAQINISDDPTVRRGDKVADASGKLTYAPKTMASAANYTPRPRVAPSSIFPSFPAFAAR